MPLHISKGNMKLGNIPNLSLPPIITCQRGVPCTKHCYAMKAWRQYPGTRKAWEDNWNLFKQPGAFYESLHEWLTKHKPKYFRFHVGGDIPNALYYGMMVSIAEQFPSTKFLAFTKNQEALASNVRATNLALVLSRWPGDNISAKVLAKHPPCAWMYDPDNVDKRISSDAIQCPGSCKNCKVCFNMKPGDHVVFHKH